MPAIQRDAAVTRLIQSVKEATPDDLAEIYNELFPETPTTASVAAKQPQALVRRIISHINEGLEVEEILDLWNVIFPQHSQVRFDEDDFQIHYEEDLHHAGHID